MLRFTLITASLFAASVSALETQTTVCEQQGLERKIEIVYPQNTAVPCEVQYTKDGVMEVLWNAQGQPGYCEERAAAFVEKQISWGWQCAAQSADEPAGEVNESSEDRVSVIEWIGR